MLTFVSMTFKLKILDSRDIVGHVLAHDHKYGILRNNDIALARHFNLMTIGVQVQGLVAFFYLQRQVLDFVGRFPAEYGIAILRHRQRIPRPYLDHYTCMHGVVFANARGQIESAPSLVRCFEGLNQDSVTNDHDILQGIQHTPKIEFARFAIM